VLFRLRLRPRHQIVELLARAIHVHALNAQLRVSTAETRNSMCDRLLHVQVVPTVVSIVVVVAIHVVVAANKHAVAVLTSKTGVVVAALRVLREICVLVMLRFVSVATVTGVAIGAVVATATVD
jgi:hypothetical protein